MPYKCQVEDELMLCVLSGPKKLKQTLIKKCNWSLSFKGQQKRTEVYLDSQFGLLSSL